MNCEHTNDFKEWRKFLRPLVTCLIAFFTAATLYLQRTDSSQADVRLANIEASIASMNVWKEKTEVKIDASSKEISTLNVQLAQVLVKIDNVIDCLKELKDANRR